MDLGITGKVALVTGSNRGTGEVIANRLEQEGCLVIRHALKHSDIDTMDSCAKEKPIICGDLANNEGADACLEQLWEHTSHIDILINNYGVASGGKWDVFEEENWIEIYQKNVLSAARLISAVIPKMKPLGWGRIIQLSTIGSLSPNARMPHYYASKGALSNMTISLAKELKGTGITVNTISPGLILTEELKMSYTIKAQRKGWGKAWQEIEAAIVKHDFPNLCNRIATKEEVADAVCFLASTKAGFINAQNLRIDGGSIAITV